ncbi:hypothetical protein STCU_04860 [Strigomonas culicis]|uniref:Uncharacterized protein n=1 Tax=Strigomonas culicis TaxID=28005 RepID=S9U0G8_9TRYP|nr:hypothetical protein STCU_07278 [Strigomonas culicis]EPY28829.1 hypothetical protein STCU_04860 [Strigomonas culicis]|eukprot:EPY24242.1 hypothetical protein STCU_07278 [Strigomonas culicis]
MSVASVPHDPTQIEEDGNEANTQLLELQDAVVNALTASGILGRLRAQLRASTLGLLKGDKGLIEASVGKAVPLAALTLEHRVVLLLIKDFFEKGGYTETLGMFEAESNVRLLGEEEEHAARTVASHFEPEESILEQLLVSSMRDPEGLSRAKTASTVAPDQDGNVNDEVDAVSEEPSDVDVTRGLQGYEPSLDFSDGDGPIDTLRMDEIETV